MKILKPFTNLFTKTGKDVKTQSLDYDPNKDVYKRVHEREAAEKKRREKWSKELKQSMNTNNNNYTYASSIGQLPGGYAGSTISTTSIADSKINIDGGENGSMRVDVPLIVNGRDVMKELDEMRDVLLLLKRDVDMEDKYPKLKKLKDEYERALEMYKTFETIKESK